MRLVICNPVQCMFDHAKTKQNKNIRERFIIAASVLVATFIVGIYLFIVGTHSSLVFVPRSLHHLKGNQLWVPTNHDGWVFFRFVFLYRIRYFLLKLFVYWSELIGCLLRAASWSTGCLTMKQKYNLWGRKPTKDMWSCTEARCL